MRTNWTKWVRINKNEDELTKWERDEYELTEKGVRFDQNEWRIDQMRTRWVRIDLKMSTSWPKWVRIDLRINWLRTTLYGFKTVLFLEFIIIVIVCPLVCKSSTFYLSRRMTKPTKSPVHPAKTLISLGIHPVWSESSLALSGWLRTQCFFMRTPKTLGTCHFAGFVMRRLICFIWDLLAVRLCCVILDVSVPFPFAAMSRMWIKNKSLTFFAMFIAWRS